MSWKARKVRHFNELGIQLFSFTEKSLIVFNYALEGLDRFPVVLKFAASCDNLLFLQTSNWDNRFQSGVIIFCVVAIY